ncbi:hypothetical protein QIS96_24080 [Streptomyces sp. B-S-A6]|uniref:HTH tetR-type domain-containing protein n=2 Tax=Streptomyces cavernicola TaxID=3043613 RepID=A0ABT6SGA0_9ACTN|nr:hypothetical protein [Streptomyces sp. B-S-A6]MDI3406879.1 hypothetical protein [Streptomyces sp. B-S-A6]
MRAVARQAGVSLGLVNYCYDDKVTLIGAALRRIERQDMTMLDPNPAKTPEQNLRAVLRRVAGAEFLTTQYLSLRLQLWALAQAHPDHRPPRPQPRRRPARCGALRGDRLRVAGRSAGRATRASAAGSSRSRRTRNSPCTLGC